MVYPLWLMSSPKVFYQRSINISAIPGTLPQFVLKVNGQTPTEHELSFCISSSDQGLRFYLPVWRREFCLLIAAHDYTNQANRGKKSDIEKSDRPHRSRPRKHVLLEPELFWNWRCGLMIGLIISKSANLQDIVLFSHLQISIPSFL